MRHHFRNHRLHLVDLDRIDRITFALEAIFLACLLEALGHALDAVVQNVGETEEYRSLNVSQRQFVHNLAQIHLYAVFFWSHHNVTLLVDVEIIDTPSVDIVQLSAILNMPFLHLLSYRFIIITLVNFQQPLAGIV